MTETILVELCLGLISISLLVLTATVVMTAHDLRKTLQRINAVLPAGRHVLQELERTLHDSRQVVALTQRIIRHVEAAVLKGCEAAGELIEPVMALRAKAQAFFAKQFGMSNGARSGPRRHDRT